MLIDQHAQMYDCRVGPWGSGPHRLNRFNGILHLRMLRKRFIHQVIVPNGFAHQWIEDLFFDLGVYGQREADALC